MKGKFVLELTMSHRMAFIDLVASSMRCECSSRIDAFINCSESPDIITTVADLLELLTEAKYVPSPEDIPDSKLRTQ